MIKLTEEQINTLKKYSIDYYSFDDTDKLIDAIDDEMFNYLDKNDEPKKEFLELETILDYLIYE